MRDAALRAKKDEFMVPLAQTFCATVHPNVVSLIAMGMGLLAAAAVIQERYWLGLLLWLLNRLLDGLDGVIARVHGKQSDFGGYLDLLFDFVIYLVIPIAFLSAAPTVFNLWAGIALISVYVLNIISWTVLGALLEKRHMQSPSRLTSMEMPTGLIEGAETIAVYTLFFFFPAYIGYIFFIFAALVLVTAGQRVLWAARTL
ncbi:MAG: CDP-alcohol phosphatidyltransferase family protein [Caldilineaceae bacterium]|nr:CDP-alcohol phosphatidyltransferase family protein [Caldilineaceae bacterium]